MLAWAPIFAPPGRVSLSEQLKQAQIVTGYSSRPDVL